MCACVCNVLALCSYELYKSSSSALCVLLQNKDKRSSSQQTNTLADTTFPVFIAHSVLAKLRMTTKTLILAKSFSVHRVYNVSMCAVHSEFN